MRNKLLTALLFILMAVLPEGAAHAITLEGAITLALDRSEEAAIAEAGADAQHARAQRSTAFIKPQAEVTGEYFRMDTTAEENPFIPAPERELAAQVEASQLLFAGGRIYRSMALRKRLDAGAGLDLAAARRDIRLDVTLKFHEALLHEENVAVASERLRQRRDELRDAQDLRNAGMATGLDVRQAEINLNFARDDMAAAEEALEQAIIELNLAMGWQDGEEFLRPEGRLDPDETAIDEALAALEQALRGDGTVDLRRAQTSMEAAQLQYRMSRGEYLPELRLVGRWRTSDTDVTDEPVESWAAGLRLSWTLLDGGLRRAQNAETHAGLRHAEQELRQARKNLRGRLESLRLRAATLKARRALYAMNVESSLLNYEDARASYRAGMLTLTSLGEFGLAWAGSRFALTQTFFSEQVLLAEARSLLE